MAVDPAFVEEIRALAADAKPSGLEALDSMPKLLGYVIEDARANCEDECDAVEALVRALRLEKRHLRECRLVLGKLGYTEVARRLRELARLRRCE